jgi:hypothetical protein
MTTQELTGLSEKLLELRTLFPKSQKGSNEFAQHIKKRFPLIDMVLIKRLVAAATRKQQQQIRKEQHQQ